MPRISSVVLRSAPQSINGFADFLRCLAAQEYCFCMLRAECRAGLRSSRLEEKGCPLRRGFADMWPGDAEVFAFVVDLPHLACGCERSAFMISYRRGRMPAALPELGSVSRCNGIGSTLFRRSINLPYNKLPYTPPLSYTSHHVRSECLTQSSLRR